MLSRHHEGEVMGKLDGKVAVITGGSSGMALASAKRFVEEGAYVFITGRRQEALDEAVKLIGRNVTGVRGDAANLDDLDRLFDTVKREKGKIDILYASAGTGEAVPLGEITEQHFDATFGLNARGTLFTVQKALPLFNDGGSIFMTGSVASIKGFPGYSVYAASKATLHAFARTFNGWADRAVADAKVREIYDLMKWGPTSANCSPARFVWVRSADGKATLAGLAAEQNKPKILQAPVTVIIGHDLDFAGQLPKLMPHNTEAMQKYFAARGVAEVTAMRNGTLQGAYLIVAADPR